MPVWVCSFPATGGGLASHGRCCWLPAGGCPVALRKIKGAGSRAGAAAEGSTGIYKITALHVLMILAQLPVTGGAACNCDRLAVLFSLCAEHGCCSLCDSRAFCVHHTLCRLLGCRRRLHCLKSCQTRRAAAWHGLMSASSYRSP